jgi:hypothetical protein
MPDLSLLLKIKYSKHLQDKEDKKDTKASSGSYKHRQGDSYSTDESSSPPPTTAATRGLYHGYTVTSQSYSTRSITNSIDAFNKPDAAVELDTAAEPAAEPADAITVAECYIGSTAFFYITNHR